MSRINNYYNYAKETSLPSDIIIFGNISEFQQDDPIIQYLDRDTGNIKQTVNCETLPNGYQHVRNLRYTNDGEYILIMVGITIYLIYRI